MLCLISSNIFLTQPKRSSTMWAFCKSVVGWLLPYEFPNEMYPAECDAQSVLALLPELKRGHSLLNGHKWVTQTVRLNFWCWNCQHYLIPSFLYLHMTSPANTEYAETRSPCATQWTVSIELPIGQFPKWFTVAPQDVTLPKWWNSSWSIRKANSTYTDGIMHHTPTWWSVSPSAEISAQSRVVSRTLVPRDRSLISKPLHIPPQRARLVTRPLWNRCLLQRRQRIVPVMDLRFALGLKATESKTHLRVLRLKFQATQPTVSSHLLQQALGFGALELPGNALPGRDPFSNLQGGFAGTSSSGVSPLVTFCLWTTPLSNWPLPSTASGTEDLRLHRPDVRRRSQDLHLSFSLHFWQHSSGDEVFKIEKVPPGLRVPSSTSSEQEPSEARPSEVASDCCTAEPFVVEEGGGAAPTFVAVVDGTPGLLANTEPWLFTDRIAMETRSNNNPNTLCSIAKNSCGKGECLPMTLGCGTPRRPAYMRQDTHDQADRCNQTGKRSILILLSCIFFASCFAKCQRGTSGPRHSNFVAGVHQEATSPGVLLDEGCWYFQHMCCLLTNRDLEPRTWGHGNKKEPQQEYQILLPALYRHYSFWT